MKKAILRKPRPASPAGDPYKRRSWETDEDYNDRIEHILSKSQEDLQRDQLAIDAASLWLAEYDKSSSVERKLKLDEFLRKKQRLENRLLRIYNSIYRAEKLTQQSIDTAKLDVSTAYNNQELKKKLIRSEKMHDANLMLQSLETAGGIFGIANFAPYMYLKYGPQALNYIGRLLAKRGLVNQTRQLIVPLIDMAIAAQLSMNGNALKLAEAMQDINLYSGAAVDAALIYTLPDIKNKLINAAELVPVAFDKVPNNYARLFSNLGGLAANVYDTYQNINN